MFSLTWSNSSSETQEGKEGILQQNANFGMELAWQDPLVCPVATLVYLNMKHLLDTLATILLLHPPACVSVCVYLDRSTNEVASNSCLSTKCQGYQSVFIQHPHLMELPPPLWSVERIRSVYGTAHDTHSVSHN